MAKRALTMGIGVIVVTGVVIAAVSCGPAENELGLESADGGVGTISEGALKCNGGTNGDTNYCSDTCTCSQGEGDCDDDANCTGGTVCCPAKGLQFGLPTKVDVCAPAHCRDKKLDGDETQPDCGGSCGTFCGASSCASLPANGVAGHCTSDCPCAADQGGCTTSGECQSGLVCQNSPPDGPYFGMETTIRVCVPTTCSDKTQDGDETGVDCGGSCVPCLGGSVLNATYGGSSASAKSDVVLGTAYDSGGNLYVAGRTSNATIDFGTGTLTSAGGQDVFLAKFDPTGVNLWSKLIGGPSNDGDSGVGVATDASGNVILVGDMYETVDFGGTCGTLTIPGGGTTEADVFVAKFDATGACQWANHYGSGSGTGSARTQSVAADSSGNIYVAGSYQTSVNLGGSTFTAASASNGVSRGIYDMFVASYTSTGTYRWSSSFGSADDDQCLSVALDSSGYLYLAGLFSDSVTFGSTNLTSAGNTDAVGMRVSPSTGKPAWAVNWGGTGADRANAVEWIRTTNQAVFGGRFASTVNFGAGNVKSAGSYDGFVVALNATSHAYNWSTTLGGKGADQVTLIAARATNSTILVGGEFAQTVNFGGGTRSTASGSSTTATDGFNVFYDSSSSAGTYLTDETYGGTGNETPHTAAVDAGSLAIVVVGGEFSSDSIVLGGQTFSNTAPGAYDAFVSQLML